MEGDGPVAWVIMVSVKPVVVATMVLGGLRTPDDNNDGGGSWRWFRL